MADRVQTQVRLDSDLHARLVAQAERRDVSVNRLVEWAVERTLPGWEAQNLEDLTRG